MIKLFISWKLERPQRFWYWFVNWTIITCRGTKTDFVTGDKFGSWRAEASVQGQREGGQWIPSHGWGERQGQSPNAWGSCNKGDEASWHGKRPTH